MNKKIVGDLVFAFYFVAYLKNSSISHSFSMGRDTFH